MKRRSYYKEFDFTAPNLNELENYIKQELRETIRIGYEVRYQLSNRFLLMNFWHGYSLKMIGEILFEFEHWVDYTYGEEVGRYFYQDLIDHAIEEANKKDNAYTCPYPGILTRLMP